MKKCPMCGKTCAEDNMECLFIDNDGTEYYVCAECDEATTSVIEYDDESEVALEYVKNCLADCSNQSLIQWMNGIIDSYLDEKKEREENFMSYTAQNLSKNENVILKGSINMIAMFPNAIIAALILIIFIYTGVETEIGFITFLGLVIAAIIIGIKYLKMKTTELSLTNKKIIGKVGIISTKVMDSPLNKINNISVEQGLGGKIFGYGKIVITTAAGNYNFSCISQPNVFRSAVMNQIDVFDEERIRKQAEQLAGAMKQQ